MASMKQVPFVRPERIEHTILVARGEKVLLDTDLAQLYGVPTKALLQAVRRNAARFPADFMFRLTSAEAANLRSQTVTSSWGGRRHLPYAFSEHGVAMLATVLRSERAVRVSIEIIRAFVRLRKLLSEDAALARRVAALERDSATHGQRIAVVFEALRGLSSRSTPDVGRRRIGFRPARGAQARRRLQSTSRRAERRT